MSYREVGEVRDGMQIDWDVPIKMDDGIVLRADVYRPLAKGKHMDLSLGFMTGEAETLGSPKFDLGIVVKMTVGGSDPFNGKYYIMGITHRHAASSRDGMSTVLRLARDAAGG